MQETMRKTFDQELSLEKMKIQIRKISIFISHFFLIILATEQAKGLGWSGFILAQLRRLAREGLHSSSTPSVQKADEGPQDVLKAWVPLSQRDQPCPLS